VLLCFYLPLYAHLVTQCSALAALAFLHTHAQLGLCSSDHISYCISLIGRYYYATHAYYHRTCVRSNGSGGCWRYEPDCHTVVTITTVVIALTSSACSERPQKESDVHFILCNDSHFRGHCSSLPWALTVTSDSIEWLEVSVTLQAI
jgi:hypothetical protein